MLLVVVVIYMDDDGVAPNELQLMINFKKKKNQIFYVRPFQTSKSKFQKYLSSHTQ